MISHICYMSSPRRVNLGAEVPPWSAKILTSITKNYYNPFLVTSFEWPRWNLACWGAFVRSGSSPTLVNFGKRSRDTMRQHASVVHWCTRWNMHCKSRQHSTNPWNWWNHFLLILCYVASGRIHINNRTKLAKISVVRKWECQYAANARKFFRTTGSLLICSHASNICQSRLLAMNLGKIIDDHGSYFYTVSPKEEDTELMAVALSNVNQLSKSFHLQTQQYICSKSY